MNPTPTPTPTCGTLVCAIRDLTDQVGDPWPQFWLTVIATLAGALIASVAAWVFAIDLHKRQQRASYDGQMDTAIAEIAKTIRSVMAGRRYGFVSQARAMSKTRRRMGDESIRSAIAIARIIATSQDDQVLRALSRRVDQWQQLASPFQLVRRSLIPGETGFWAYMKDDDIPAPEYSEARKLLRENFESYSRDPFVTIWVLQRWRRGETTNAETILRLDPRESPLVKTPERVVDPA